MKVKELKYKTVGELNRILADLRRQLRELRFNLAAGKVKNIRAIRTKKKDIARVLTILHQKEVGKEENIK